MDLICDRVIRQLLEDIRRETVRVVITIRTSILAARFAEVDPNDLVRVHEVEFGPRYPRSWTGGTVLSVSGVCFRPSRPILKTLVTGWLDQLAAESGREEGRMHCVLDLEAACGERKIYEIRGGFDYFPGSAGRNKKAVNRLVEALLRVKGLCDSLVSSA
jgi:hypothetical protein